MADWIYQKAYNEEYNRGLGYRTNYNGGLHERYGYQIYYNGTSMGDSSYHRGSQFRTNNNAEFIDSGHSNLIKSRGCQLDFLGFTGYGLESWLFHVESLFIANRFCNSRKLEVVTRSFVGEALCWWQQISKVCSVHYWEELKGLLIQQFGEKKLRRTTEQFPAVNQERSYSGYVKEHLQPERPPATKSDVFAAERVKQSEEHAKFMQTMDDRFALLIQRLDEMIEEQNGKKVALNDNSNLVNAVHIDENRGAKVVEMLTENTTVSIKETKTNLQEIHHSGNDELKHSSLNAIFEKDGHPFTEAHLKTEIEEMKNFSEEHRLLRDNPLKEDESILFDEFSEMQPRLSADTKLDLEVYPIIEVQRKLEVAVVNDELKNDNLSVGKSPKTNNNCCINDGYILFAEVPKKYYDVGISVCHGFVGAASYHIRREGVGIILGRKHGKQKHRDEIIFVFDPGGLNSA